MYVWSLAVCFTLYIFYHNFISPSKLHHVTKTAFVVNIVPGVIHQYLILGLPNFYVWMSQLCIWREWLIHTKSISQKHSPRGQDLASHQQNNSFIVDSITKCVKVHKCICSAFAHTCDCLALKPALILCIHEINLILIVYCQQQKNTVSSCMKHSDASINKVY